MKSLLPAMLIALLCLCAEQSQSQPKCFIQLYPENPGRFVFQIQPDQTYEYVAIYVNFYNASNRAVKQNQRYLVTTSENKYLLANQVYSFVYENRYPNIAWVKLASITRNTTIGQFDRRGYNNTPPPNPHADEPLSPVMQNSALENIPPSSSQLNTNLSSTAANSGNNNSGSSYKEVIVRSSYQCDLEQAIQSTTGDFWWNVQHGRNASIVPKNGARFYAIPGCTSCFDEITYAALRDYDNRSLLTTESIPTVDMSPGNVIAFVTSNGLYGLFRIEGFIGANASDIRILVRTFPKKKATAVK